MTALDEQGKLSNAANYASLDLLGDLADRGWILHPWETFERNGILTRIPNIIFPWKA